MRWLGAAIAVVVAALPVACTSGAGGPDTGDGVPLPGAFSPVAATFRAPDGTVVEACALLADTSAERAQGLMGVTDLDPWPAMVFDFGEPVSGGFWMKDTPLSLSIAFYDEFGVFVSSADMEPCPGGDCPSTYATRPYRYAVEVEQGRLDEVAAVFGGSLTLGGSCEGSPAGD